ncbi:MAG: helix-turn-helix transcriptional regulator [Nitrosotalea sp.]
MAHRAKKKNLFARKDVKKLHRVTKHNPDNKTSHKKTRQNRRNFKGIAKNYLVYMIPWTLLSPKQKSIRKPSLEVLSTARKSNQSLSKISKNHGISVRTVIKNTNAFKKINGKWVPKKFDKISRVLKINEKGQEKSIEIKDSRTASVIGSYHNAVKIFLNTGNVEQLQKFKKKKIKDANGKIHVLETNSQELININERIEEPEFYEVYVS